MKRPVPGVRSRSGARPMSALARIRAASAIGALIFAGACSSQPGKPAAAPPAPAAPCTGTLGIEAVPASEEMRRTLGLPADFHGAIVGGVLAGGPGAEAGLQIGDIVEKVGDQDIENDCDFSDVAHNRSCDPVRVELKRGGKAVEATLKPVDQTTFYGKACAEGVAAACFREGWLQWKRSGGGAESQGRALALFTTACHAGSAEGCAYQALAATDSPDHAGEALAAATRACDLGSGAGCANLGFLYATGKLVAKDDARAAKFYVRSCELGDAQGCYNAGLMSDDGRGTHADPAAAAARYTEACDLGSSTACTNLGFLYERGRGVKADRSRAFALYEQGCRGSSCQPSNLGGCVNVGRAYRDGIGVAKNEAKAAEVFREACDRKPVSADIHAAENGSRACSLLGALYLAGDGIEKDLDSGRKLSELGCERGDSFGCFNAAAVYASGSGVAADPATAASFLEKACAGGDGEGCHDLAVAYEKGNGVKRDTARAAELDKKSCELGFEKACPKKPKPKSKRKPKN